MPRSKDPKQLGRSILIGIATGAVPLASLGIVGTATPVEAQAQLSGEAELFNQAVASNDPDLISEYIRAFPNGRIRELLRSQPASVLSRIDPGALALVDRSQLSRLSDRVISNMPNIARERASNEESSGLSSEENETDDTYGTTF